MVLSIWKTAAYRGNSTSRKLMDVAADVEDRPDPEPVTEKVFRSQRVKIKRECTSGQTWEVEVNADWMSSQHQHVGQQITNCTLVRNLTRSSARSGWMALDTINLLESYLIRLEL